MSDAKKEEFIDVESADYQEAMDLAHGTYQKFQESAGHYTNTLNSHERGKIGEFACLRCLEKYNLKCGAKFKNLGNLRDADIIVHGDEDLCVEVKTWNEKYWDEWGRCIAVEQFPALTKKANVVIWCITPDITTPPVRVTIAGWNKVDDIENAPKRWTGPSNRQVHNHQVDNDKLRPMADFLNKFRG